MSIKVNITIDEQLINQIRSDNALAADLDREELVETILEFVDELSTPEGFSMVLENLDYFNQ